MGLTNVALQMAKSALAAQSLGLEVTGNNVANANNDTYARRRVGMVSSGDIRLSGNIMQGTGVSVTGIQRTVDEFLEQRIRDANADCTSLEEQQLTLERIEGIYNELGDSDLSSMMNEFFNALNDLSNYPDESAQRQLVVSIGENLTEHIQTLRTGIDDARASINEQFNAAIDNINALAQQLAELNTEIVSAEGGGIYAGSAGSLRDQRDAVLRELSDLVSISTFEQTSGAVEISVGSHTLVSTGEYFGLSVADALDVDRATGEWITNADELTDLDKHRIPLVYAVFDIDGSELVTEGGLVHGYLVSRDESLAGQADALDTLTESLIFEMNKIHSEGSGTASLDSIRSLNAVSDADAALTDAGLHWRAENGAFSIRVHDLATGLVKTVGVEVDLDGIGSDDTLNSLAGKINAAMTAAGVSVTATVNSDNTLSIDSGATDTGFTFCDDTSNLLACLGINTFFSGYDSANIGVNALVSENIGFVAAALSTSPDDGSNAVRMVDLRSTTLDALGGLSMEEYYQSMISDLGIESSVAGSRSEGAGAYRESLLAERESISGVNMDEEAINLMRYQRAYQAAAHYITIIDELLQTMLNIV